jgi:hypothetical protein
MGVAAALLSQLCATVIVRVGGVIVTIRTILPVRVILGGRAIVMVTERHALASRDSGQPLDRHSQRQEHDSENSEETFRHLGRL